MARYWNAKRETRGEHPTKAKGAPLGRGKRVVPRVPSPSRSAGGAFVSHERSLCTSVWRERGRGSAHREAEGVRVVPQSASLAQGGKARTAPK